MDLCPTHAKDIRITFSNMKAQEIEASIIVM